MSLYYFIGVSFLVQLVTSFTAPSPLHHNHLHRIGATRSSEGKGHQLICMIPSSYTFGSFRVDPQFHRLNYAKELDACVPNSLMRREKGAYNAQEEVNESKQKQRRGSPSKFEELWDTRYTELLEFYKVNGHSNVPYNHPNRKLSRWVTNQRQNKSLNRRCLTEERIKALEQIQFSFRCTSTWEDRFNELKEFSSNYGNCNVPQLTNRELHRFVTSQRKLYKSYLEETVGTQSDNGNLHHDEKNSNCCMLTKDRVEALISIGFDFTKKGNSKDSAWIAKYNQLKQCQQGKHQFTVPSNDINLRHWVDIQRTAFRLANKGEQSSLTQERIDKLNEISFVWDPKEARFNERVMELIVFREENKHCNVQMNTNPTLHSWIQRQRKQYQRYLDGEKCSLTRERIDCLNRLGLDLGGKHVEGIQNSIKTPWIEKFYQLQEYAQQHGHCIVPQTHPHLGTFVRAQRNSYRLMKMGKKSSMTKERIDKLNSLGFVWYIRNKKQPQNSINEEKALITTRNAIFTKRMARLSSPTIVSKNPDALLKQYEKTSLWG